MSITRMHTSERMSKIVIHNGLVYLCGQVGEGANITEQTSSMLASVDALLAEAGSSKSSILSATIWLKTMDDYDALNLVWDAWIDPDNPPARACGESRLATDDFLVEVIITAAQET